MSDMVSPTRSPGVPRSVLFATVLALGLPGSLSGCSVDLKVEPAPQPTVAPAAGPAVRKEDLSRQLAEQFAQRTGRRPAEVNCPNDLPRVIGAEVRCSMIDADRHTGVATATLTEQTRISYRFDIDLATPPAAGAGR